MQLRSAAAAPGGRHWTNVGSFGGGQHQACKALTEGGTTWKVYNRLVNGKQGPVGAGMTVYKNDKAERTWNSGLIAKGQTSKLGSVTLPKGDDRFSLESFECQSQAGDGGPIKLSKIGRC